MKTLPRIFFRSAALVFALLIVMSGVSHAAYPTRPVTIIVPFAAGGGTDLVTRFLAEAAEPFLGQPINVVNQTGGGGAVGMAAGAFARPDGYTIFMATVEWPLYSLTGVGGFKVDDAEPIIRVNADPASFTVRSESPYETLEDFIATARGSGRQLSVATGPPGSVWYLAPTTLENETGVTFNKVPASAGAAEQAQLLLGGHVEAMTASPAETLEQILAGNFRVLAVASDERLPSLPDVPTFKELGYDVVVQTWRGLMAPGGTPPEIVEALHDAFYKAMQTDGFKQEMERAGFGTAYLSRTEFEQYLKDEVARFEPVLEQLGLLEN